MEKFTVIDERTNTVVCIHIFKPAYSIIEKAALVNLACNVVLPTFTRKPS